MAVDIWQSHASLMLALFLLFPTSRLPRHWQAVLLALLFAVSCWSINGLALAAYLRSVVGQPATATIVWMAFAALVRLQLVEPAPSRQRTQAAIVFGVLGLVMYPAALGLTQFDPYRLGYDADALLGLIAVCSAVLVYAGNTRAACLLAIATLAFVLHLQASGNYWDYLLDPFLVVFCWGIMARRAWAWLRARRHHRAMMPITMPVAPPNQIA